MLKTSSLRAVGMGTAALIALILAPSTFGGGGHGHEPPAAPASAAPLVPAHAPVAPTATPATPAHAAGVPADEALQMLVDGNGRFMASAPQRPHQDQARLCDTFANGQHPFAAVLSCADSRVPPELLFDAGIGDLFVVRVAGNVADVDEIGTLEYGVEHLGINAIVVMGHQKCGAVTAVIDKAKVSPNIEKLVDNIAPAADRARAASPKLAGARLVERAIRMNVQQSINDLTAKSDILRDRVKSGTLKITGAVYNLHTGEVDWIEPTTDIAAALKPQPEPSDVRNATKPADPRRPKEKAAAPANHDAHGPKADADHDEPAADGPHADAKNDAVQIPEAAAKPRKDNYLALGAFAGGAAVTSYGIIHFMRAR